MISMNTFTSSSNTNFQQQPQQLPRVELNVQDHCSKNFVASVDADDDSDSTTSAGIPDIELELSSSSSTGDNDVHHKKQFIIGNEQKRWFVRGVYILLIGSLVSMIVFSSISSILRNINHTNEKNGHNNNPSSSAPHIRPASIGSLEDQFPNPVELITTFFEKKNKESNVDQYKAKTKSDSFVNSVVDIEHNDADGLMNQNGGVAQQQQKQSSSSSATAAPTVIKIPNTEMNVIAVGNNDGNEEKEVFIVDPVNEEDDDANGDDDTYKVQMVDGNVTASFEEVITETKSANDVLVVNDNKNVSLNTPPNLTASIGPQIVWLLSFPDSGSSYMIRNIEQVTGFTTASNYAHDVQSVIVPVRKDLMNGPFLHQPSKPIPDYVLTKTNCAGYCDECSPASYVVNTTNDFIMGCSTTVLSNTTSGEEQSSHYARTVPVKAVHLIRNPFDNIIERLHTAIQKRENAGLLSKDHSAALTSTKEGFDAWCEYIDTKYELEEKESNLLSDEIKNLFKNVPCHGDWYRFTQFHNNVVSMIDELKIPVHVTYYEDLIHQYRKTFDTLFEFLNVHEDKIDDPFEFAESIVHRKYFTTSDEQNAFKLVQALSTPKSWNLLKHYFRSFL